VREIKTLVSRKTAEIKRESFLSMIKIAYIIDTIESPTAGTEKQLLMLIKHLDRSRFAPTLFVLQSSKWLENEFDLCPLEIINIKSFFSFRSLVHFLSFIKRLQQQKFDCLQTHFIDSNIIGIVAAKMAGVPNIISSRRDQGYWHTPGKLFLIKMLNSWASFVVANCHATAKWASNAEGIPSERIKVIYNGAELDDFSISTINGKNTVRSSLGIPEDVLLVGIVANLRPVKRIDIFLRSAAIVMNTLPDVWFVVVGDGEQSQELELLAMQLEISDKTSFLGKRTDIPNVLKALDVAVLSSDSESFSNSIVEYMATGLPVVTTDVGGCREMIVDGENGFIVRPSDPETMAEQIIKLLTSTDCALIGQNNNEKARKLFSCEVMVHSFEQLYADGRL
jgi:glycosyltransferase involved in cell wall biosynthesis